jgi:Cu-processing system permease protein
MTQVTIIAGREIRDALRNRWVVAATLVLAIFALSLAFLGSAPTGTVAASPLAVTAVSLSSLTIFLIPLIALLLSYDAVLGEIDRGTMALLLTYPVARWEVLAGKFLGHVAVLTFAILVGYGVAGAALWFASEQPDPYAWYAFASMIASSVLLGAAFIAIGYLVNTLVRDRGTAAGVAVGIWLVFVLIYDMALLGGLVADQGRFMTPAVLNVLLLLNPADAYRLFNLAGFANVGALSGLAGLGEQTRIGPAMLIGAMTLWVVVPLLLAAALFTRRSV